MRASRPQAVSGQGGCNKIGPSEHRSKEDPLSVSLHPAMSGGDVVNDGCLYRGRERGRT